MNIEKLLVFHRHWHWTNAVKEQYVKELDKYIKKRKNKTKTLSQFFKTKVSENNSYLCKKIYAFMYIWYGLLFSLLEFLENEQISIPSVDYEIKNTYSELKLCRNAVFHPQNQYLSYKLQQIILTKGSRDIRKIHDEIGKYIANELNVRKLTLPKNISSILDGLTQVRN